MSLQCVAAYIKKERFWQSISSLRGRCINGAGCLTHGDEKNKSLVEKYGKAAGYKTINDVVSKL